MVDTVSSISLDSHVSPCDVEQLVLFQSEGPSASICSSGVRCFWVRKWRYFHKLWLATPIQGGSTYQISMPQCHHNRKPIDSRNKQSSYRLKQWGIDGCPPHSSMAYPEACFGDIWACIQYTMSLQTTPKICKDNLSKNR